MLAAVERLDAGREELQADLLAEGADILAQLGGGALAGAGAPPVRTAEALLDHVRSLHADAVADGADASPLVLLATIEQRLRGSTSRSAHPALSAATQPSQQQAAGCARMLSRAPAASQAE